MKLELKHKTFNIFQNGINNYVPKISEGKSEDGWLFIIIADKWIRACAIEDINLHFIEIKE
jgi:hypothetical protein